MNERYLLTEYLDNLLKYAKRCECPEKFFHQAFGAVGVYCHIAYVNGYPDEEKAVADLWNNEYRGKFEELIYGKVGA